MKIAVAVVLFFTCIFGTYRASAMEATMVFKHAPHEDGEVFLFIPDEFNPHAPTRIVIYFHGDIPDETFAQTLTRQRLSQQIRDAHVNAVLVAPLLGTYSAAPQHYKNFTDGGFDVFIVEAKEKLVALANLPTDAFDRASVTVIAYSGGYGALKAVVQNGANLAAILMLDAHYREQDMFANAAARAYWQGRVFVSAYTDDTILREKEFEEILAIRQVPFMRRMPDTLPPGSVALIHITGNNPDELHKNFVTHAWTQSPVADFLRRAYQ